MTRPRIEESVRAETEAVGFSRFYEEHYPSAARLAYLLTQSRLMCEDLAQEAFARVHGRFDDLDRPVAYLRVTVLNLCREWHRREGQRARRLALLHPIAGDLPPDVADVLDAVSRLAYRPRAILVLRYWIQRAPDFSAFALDDTPYLLDVVTRLSRSDVQSRFVDQAKRGLKLQVPVVIGVEVGPA